MFAAAWRERSITLHAMYALFIVKLRSKSKILDRGRQLFMQLLVCTYGRHRSNIHVAGVWRKCIIHQETLLHSSMTRYYLNIFPILFSHTIFIFFSFTYTRSICCCSYVFPYKWKEGNANFKHLIVITTIINHFKFNH